MKLKACIQMVDHFCLMKSIPFPVLYNVLSRSYVKQRIKRNEAFKENESLRPYESFSPLCSSCPHHLMFLRFVSLNKSPEPLLIAEDLFVYCCRKYVFFSSKNVTNINKIWMWVIRATTFVNFRLLDITYLCYFTLLDVNSNPFK